MKTEDDLIKKFLNKNNIFAVVGVSRDKEKFGWKVYSDLKSKGYEVYAINPKAQLISETKCYPTIKDLPQLPDVVSFVVPARITEEVLLECKELGIEKVWMQPGSESEKAIDFCKDNQIDVLYDVCVMVEEVK